jgi:hypothetical protein
MPTERSGLKKAAISSFVGRGARAGQEELFEYETK